MAIELLQPNELPYGLRYPAAFLRLVDRELLYFEPWFILEGDRLRTHLRGLMERYPTRQLLPFARREDSDDMACWEAGRPHKVMIVHDYASPGWEQRAELDDFYAWIRLAVEDMIAYDSKLPADGDIAPAAGHDPE